MVRALHAAGLEVILDVVYNHTAEGNHVGPTLSLRGIDNASYYRLSPADPRFYEDFTGSGNTLNMRSPRVLQLIMDSLRYWVLEMHVDGFRFDLASALARELFAVDKLGSFFDIIHQDPVLSRVKLIAEPWDLGEGGYQVGNFPVGWTEWNGKYRDAVRRFWRGDRGQVSEMATRLAGSSDLYEQSGRRPYASVNFVTSHDGFSLHDLVRYNEKHNEANGEDNRDGEVNNFSWNFGVEGPTDDPAIVEARERQKRNFLATLFLSQGVPMLVGGDELGHTRLGNNNPYCQDNELNWIDWTSTPAKEDAARFRPRHRRAPATAPDSASPPLLPGTRHSRRRRQGHRVVRRRRRGDGRRRVAVARGAGVRCPAVGRRHRGVRRPGTCPSSTIRWSSCSTRRTRRFRSPCRRRRMRAGGPPSSDTSRPEPDQRRLAGGEAYQLDGRSLVLFRLGKMRPNNHTGDDDKRRDRRRDRPPAQRPDRRREPVSVAEDRPTTPAATTAGLLT